MTFTYSVDGSTRDLVRLAVGDTDTVDSNKQIFTDEEIAMLGTAYGTDINVLAGHCMMAIASSAARIATVCSIGNRDFMTDRKAVARECREQAQAFFKHAKDTLSATEVALEDKEIEHVDRFRDDDSQEISLTNLNT